MHLSPEERRFLLAACKGEGLFFARGTHVALQVQASPLEHQLATTSPRELATREAGPREGENTADGRAGAGRGVPRGVPERGSGERNV
jgi:hypothetical protein